jgi:hypothetical protein
MMRFAYLSLAVFAFELHWLFLHPLLVDQHSTSSDEIDYGIWIFVCCWILLEAYWLKSRTAPPAPGLADKRAKMWTKMKEWLEGEAQAQMSRDEAQAASNRHARQMLDNLAMWPVSDECSNHFRDALLYGFSAQKTWMEQPTMQIRMHRGSIDAARKTEETILATIEAVRGYLVRHDWPEALIGTLEVNEYSKTPAHGWNEHYIVLLNKIPVGFASSPVRLPAPVIVAVDLAKPEMDHTAIIVAARQGGRSADAALWGILGDGMITPQKVADVRPPAVLRARRKGKGAANQRAKRKQWYVYGPAMGAA